MADAGNTVAFDDYVARPTLSRSNGHAWGMAAPGMSGVDVKPRGELER
jgi:hypothetical protein